MGRGGKELRLEVVNGTPVQRRQGGKAETHSDLDSGREASEVEEVVIAGDVHTVQISSRVILNPGNSGPASSSASASMRWGLPAPLAGQISTAC